MAKNSNENSAKHSKSCLGLPKTVANISKNVKTVKNNK